MDKDQKPEEKLEAPVTAPVPAAPPAVTPAPVTPPPAPVEIPEQELARANSCLADIKAALLKHDCHIKIVVSMSSDTGTQFTYVASTNPKK